METASSNIQLYTTSHEAWDAMYDALLNARVSIYWEMYTFVDDAAGRRFVDALIQKAKAGVATKLVVDALGSFSLSNQAIKDMRRAGVDVILFSVQQSKHVRSRWRKLWTRSHRKLLVVDEHIGFIGGVNIQKSMEAWKDIHIRMEGKVVRSLLRAFAKNYIIAGGKKHNVRHLLKYTLRLSKERKDLEFIYDDPSDKKSNIRGRYVDALMKARKRVILFSPYYFPDKKFLKALWYARKRGVRVDMLIPFRSDLRIATYAAYAFFSLMQRRGVKVHLTKDMMHGKGIIVDDDWAMIGSSNIDQTSFYDNYEANVRISDRRIVDSLRVIVTGWIHASKHLATGEWNKRGRLHRMKEWIAYKLYTLWHRSSEHVDTLKKKAVAPKKSPQSK